MSEPKFAVHASGSRGLAVVQEVLRLVPPSQVAEIVVGNDAGCDDDKREEMKALAGRLGVRCRTPKEEPAPEEHTLVTWRILAGWREMEENTYNTVVFHDSKLPKYRGFAPVVAQLINGEPELSATAFFASERYDEGDIIAQVSEPIQYPMKIARAFQIVGGLYQRLVRQVVLPILDGQKLARWPQVSENATYSLWRDDMDYYLDWSQNAIRLQRTVNALGWPYSGARICARMPKGGFTRGVVREAEFGGYITSCGAPAVGKVAFRDKDGTYSVVCGEGTLLRLTKVEWDNGHKPTSFRLRFLAPGQLV